MIRRPPRSTLSSSSAASDVYKRQYQRRVRGGQRSSVMGTGSNGSLGCACFLGVTALVFGIVAISTVAWYDTGLHHCSSRDSTHDARLFYGPKRVCAYYGDSGDGDGQSISGVESGWECVTWGEAPQSWHGASDCKDGTTDAFGLGIAGVVLSAPAAALAAVLLCCSGQVGKLGRMAVTGCAVASGMATVFWVVAICLVASKCNNFKETASSGTVYQSLLNVECASHDPTVGPSLGILIGGLLAGIFTVCGLVVAVFWFRHCDEPQEQTQDCETTVLTVQPHAQYSEVPVQPISSNVIEYEQA
eukprot:TRINITY_DN19968_c0_g1_i3.p1 TRINITY_DN19968_c0_g1~~TRINITY_DN19968_c0_g1_i3.p1  ORF type:complete len:303 (-),score=54.63 TRINITY_DN19968_c0_g1_i3:344-1252(-)